MEKSSGHSVFNIARSIHIAYIVLVTGDAMFENIFLMHSFCSVRAYINVISKNFFKYLQ